MNKLDEQKEEAIAIIVASSVLLNDWLPTLRSLYRKTCNPVDRKGKPILTPFENRLISFEKSCASFLEYLKWDYGKEGATKEYEAIAQLGELILELQALPVDKRIIVDDLIKQYYKETHGE